MIITSFKQQNLRHYHFNELTYKVRNISEPKLIRNVATCFITKNKVKICLANTAVLLFFCHPSHASIVGKMIRPYMSYTMLADDNILRIRDNIDSQALPNINTNNLFDISHRITGGAVFDKKISRQHLSANGSWSHTRFEKFNSLNNKAIDLNGNWNWVLGNHLEGNIGTNFNKGQAPFLFQPGIKNITTQQTEYFNFSWHFHPSWKWRGDYTHFNFKSDNQRLQFQNRIENRFETGFDYVASSGSTIGIQYRNIQGKFTMPIPISNRINNYDQNEIKGKINWLLTGKSRVEFLGGWVERRNTFLSSNDFSGLNARLTYAWKPTSKIDMRLTGRRETVAIQSLNANFAVITGINVSSNWRLTEKTKISGNFSYQSQKLDRFTNQNSNGNHNNIITASIGLTYAPYPGIEVNTSVLHNSLSTNSPLGGFNANGATINIRYILGRP